MRIHDVISPYLTTAVVASVVIILINIYTGEIATLNTLIIDFIRYVVVILVGAIVGDLLWKKGFNKSVR